MSDKGDGIRIAWVVKNVLQVVDGLDGSIHARNLGMSSVVVRRIASESLSVTCPVNTLDSDRSVTVVSLPYTRSILNGELSEVDAYRTIVGSQIGTVEIHAPDELARSQATEKGSIPRCTRDTDIKRINRTELVGRQDGVSDIQEVAVVEIRRDGVGVA